jgi:hypothetical protein
MQSGLPKTCSNGGNIATNSSSLEVGAGVPQAAKPLRDELRLDGGRL